MEYKGKCKECAFTYRSDLYIMLPCYHGENEMPGIPYEFDEDEDEDDEVGGNGSESDGDDSGGGDDGGGSDGGADEEADEEVLPDHLAFIYELTNKAKFEFDNELLFSRIKRNFLRNITLYIESDGSHDMEPYKQEAFLTLSKFEGTKFCILYIVVPDINVHYVTDFLDQVSRGEIKIMREENLRPVVLSNPKPDSKPETDYLRGVLGLKDFIITGKAYYASCMSAKWEGELSCENDQCKEELRYILSAETRKNPYSTINSQRIDELLVSNQKQYDEYDLYLSDYGALCVIEDFAEDYVDRLETECLLLFIIELIVMKITAINIANREIVNEFSGESQALDYSFDKIRIILEDFSRSIPLWNIHHFRYSNAQAEAKKIEDAFHVSEYFTTYSNNLEHLENLSEVRNVIAAEEESKNSGILGIAASILAFFQVIPMFLELLFERGSTIPWWERILPYVITIIVTGFFVLVIFRKQIKRMRVAKKRRK